MSTTTDTVTVPVESLVNVIAGARALLDVLYEYEPHIAESLAVEALDGSCGPLWFGADTNPDEVPDAVYDTNPVMVATYARTAELSAAAFERLGDIGRAFRMRQQAAEYRRAGTIAIPYQTV